MIPSEPPGCWGDSRKVSEHKRILLLVSCRAEVSSCSISLSCYRKYAAFGLLGDSRPKAAAIALPPHLGQGIQNTSGCAVLLIRLRQVHSVANTIPEEKYQAELYTAQHGVTYLGSRDGRRIGASMR